MEYSNVGLNDLPDEIILIILKKLHNFDIHYSLYGVNQRLTQFIQDSIFTDDLYFTKRSSDKFVDLLSDKETHDHFCLQILPSIHDKIKCLVLASSSMKSVLHASRYPNLNCLALQNIDEESIKNLLADRNLSVPIFMNRIMLLGLAFNPMESYTEMLSSVENTFACIFPMFMKLKYLILHESSYKNYVRLNFNEPLILNFRSSTLLFLVIKVQSFDDCLYILDGRFDQLHTLIIDIVNPHKSDDVDNQDLLPNLKYFSFTCQRVPFPYDFKTVPLFSRMLNLERLDLFILFDNGTTFIGPDYLMKNTVDLRKLNSFQFSITSYILNPTNFNLSSIKYKKERTSIDSNSTDRKNIIFYFDYCPERNRSQCHFYTYPSKMIYYKDITNKFPGGLYKYVRYVSLFDEKPFEHEFFLRIQKSFPSLQTLYIKNKKPQNCKESNQNLSPIHYSSLNDLRIGDGHDDYIEEFLFDTKTELPQNIDLRIKYESLERITHNFTRESTRINCTKVGKLYFYLDDQLKCENSFTRIFS